MDLLIVPVVVFGAAAAAGVGVLVLAWPLLKMREYRPRLIGILVLVVALVVCMVFGQFILDVLASWCRPMRVGTCH
jgi:hypothetical protein